MDLNLLVVFHHLMRERHVSRAADALGLSQPAVSNALRRLRTRLGDELFLRTPAGMEPTPYAQQLAGPLSQALDTLRDALNVRASFEPATSTRCFTVAMSDVGETYFLPVLMDALARQAPGVTLRCVSVADAALREDMAQGRVDLALGSLPQLQAGFFLLPAGAVPPALCGPDAAGPSAGRAHANFPRAVPRGAACAGAGHRHRPRPGGARAGPAGR